MPTPERLADHFEEHRAHLRAVAYRMLGSASDAEDAVQESWFRLSRTDVSGVENLRAWLTTVVARGLPGHVADFGHRAGRTPWTRYTFPIQFITRADGDPESDAMLADSVGLALLVVLETLEPAERLAFVLHDVFGMTFDEIGPVVDRSPVAARQLASRARRRVQSKTANADPDLA